MTFGQHRLCAVAVRCQISSERVKFALGVVVLRVVCAVIACRVDFLFNARHLALDSAVIPFTFSLSTACADPLWLGARLRGDVVDIRSAPMRAWLVLLR